MAILRDQALVLERHPWSESSLVVHVATPAHGRVHLVARGAYRPTSRYYCVLDLFDTLALEWSAVPGRELGDLRAGEIARRRPHVARSGASYTAGVTVLELLALASRFGPPDAQLHARTEAALDALDEAGARDEAGDPAAARAAEVEQVRFELDYLAHLGFAPALETCAQCAEPAPPARGRVQFSAGAGGRLCARCAAEGRARNLRVGTLPLAVLEDARRLSAGAFPADAEPARIVRVRDWIERFLDYHLETRPRSHRAFLSVPNRNAPADRSTA